MQLHCAAPAPHSVSTQATMTTQSQRTKCYSYDDLEMFNLLERPIWVFDIDNKAMYWANNAALKLVWNADSLEDLLARNFCDDMSAATERRLNDYKHRFDAGEKIKDQWTYYPSGSGPTTVYNTQSGIFIEPGRMVMLNEADISTHKDDIDKASLRGVEMLRHCPVAVSQFDINGNLMEQNPEASAFLGGSDDTGDSPPSGSKKTFISRFVDLELGEHVLQKVQGGNDFCVEAQQNTTRGPVWAAIKVRQVKDPVTKDPVILYSARDITEVIQAKKESEFLAVLSHEIRTPLHQVTGFIELLGHTPLNTEQCEFVRSLNSSAKSLMSIINDILDSTKLEAGKMEFEQIPFDPKSVIEGALAVVEPLAKERGLQLAGHCESIPVKLMGDPNRLRQVLHNLLQNAVKFTREGSVILTATAKAAGPRQLLRVVVADTGIGICPEQAKCIFKKYQQAHSSVAREYGGTGLGLTICKTLVERMGGFIKVESEAGVGSKFIFEITFDAITADSQPTEAGKQLTASDNDTKQKMHVLVVEDNRVNQKLVGSMLKRLGHTHAITENGQEAVDAVESTPFDLVLMDVEMPIKDGIEATKELRSKGYTNATLPVIGLTASYRRADRQKYKDIGMNDCLGKPLRLKDLKATIEILQAALALP